MNCTAQSKDRVWVNGCFDVLHVGHIELLKYASTFGTLTVGVDSDDRVKDRKGSLRPFNCLKDRIEMISSIRYVDSVVSFHTDMELTYQITKSGATILVVGDDYVNERVIGSECVDKVIFFPKILGKSTTNILNFIK